MIHWHNMLIIAPPYKDETQGQSDLMEALIKSFLEQRYCSSERIMYEGDTESNLLKVLLTPHWLTLPGCGECPGDWCRGAGTSASAMWWVPGPQVSFPGLLPLFTNFTAELNWFRVRLNYGDWTALAPFMSQEHRILSSISISLRLLTICYAARDSRSTSSLLLLSHAL